MALFSSGFDQDRDLLPDAWEAVVGLSTNVLGSAHLVGWWPMEDSGTNRVDDISGGDLTGWVQGADSPMFPTGLYEGALALGSTGLVRFEPSPVSLGTDGFTFSAWVAGSNLASGARVARWEDGLGNAWELGVGTNALARLAFETNGAGGGALEAPAASPPIGDGGWHHLAGVYDAGLTGGFLYVDGNLEASGPVGHPWAGVPGSLVMGNGASSSTGSFLLDEVRLYRVPLGAEEIGLLPQTHDDPDGDGLPNLDEHRLGTLPLQADTDGDGIADGADSAPLDFFNGAPPAGPRLWVRADAGVTTEGGAVVSAWADQSGHGADLTQGAVIARPTLVAHGANGAPAIRFDGTDDWLGGQIGPIGAPMTIVAVARFAQTNQGPGDYDYVARIGQGATAYGHASISRHAADNGNTNRYYAWLGTNFAMGPALDGGGWAVLASVHATDSPRHRLYVDGGEQAVQDYARALATDGGMELGRYANGPGFASHFLKGDIAEVLVYDRALDGAEVAALTAGLKGRHGLNDPPSVGAGPDIEIIEGGVASLQGTVADDGFPAVPGAVTAQWAKVFGPGEVTFADAASPATSATFSEPGTYILRLGASDGAATAEDVVTVWVAVAGAATVPRDGLCLWLRADALALTGGASVALWPDMSGWGDALAQGASASQPRFLPASSNLPPAVAFDGTNDWLAGSVGPIGAPLTVIAVAAFDQQHQPAGDNDYAMRIGDGQAPYGHMSISRHASEGGQGDRYYSWMGTNAALGPVLGGQERLILSAVHAPSAPRHRFHVNGTAATAADYAQAVATDGSVEIGRYSHSGGYVSHHLLGSISEVLVFDRELGTNEWISVHGYLKSKYAINASPQVNAGPDKDVVRGQPISLVGEAMDDGFPLEPGQLDVTWTKVFGPGEVSFADPAAAATTATFDQPGAYVLRLTASDGRASVSDELIVVVSAVSSADLPRDGLRLWLRADALALTNGTPLASWPNLVTGGGALAQGTLAKQPTLLTNACNGLPAVRFDGSDDWLSANIGALTSSVTVVAVGRFNHLHQPANDYDYLLRVGNGALANAHLSISRCAVGGGNDDKYYSWMGSASYFGPPLEGQQWHRIAALHAAEAPRHRLRLDGAAQSVADHPQTVPFDGTVELGRYSNPSGFSGHNFKGDIAEVLVYDRALSDEELAAVDRWLGRRFEPFYGDADHDGLQDDWELAHFGGLGQDAAGDPDGDGLGNAQEQDAGTDPADFYNGSLPSLFIVSGDGQVAAGTNAVLADPLVVGVSNAAGPLPNAPLEFAFIGGDGLLSLTNGGPGSPGPIVVRTDAAGEARLWLRHGSAGHPTNRVSVTATTGGAATSVVFSAALATALPDSDYDGLDDDAEILHGTGPMDPDSDDDGIEDGYEVANGLDPLADDSFEDADGDRYPNVFESRRGSRADDPASVPQPTLTVDSAAGDDSPDDAVFSTIGAAIFHSGIHAMEYPIILVSGGRYAEGVAIRNQGPVLLLAELGSTNGPATIECAEEFAGCVGIESPAALDGFVITHAIGVPGPGIIGDVAPGPGPRRARLVNCVIAGNRYDYGAGVDWRKGRLDLVHCTVSGNTGLEWEGSGWGYGNGIYQEAGEARIVNSILWNPDGWGCPEVESPGNLSVSNSIVRDAVHGGIDEDPLLTPAGWLTANSPAIDRAGLALADASLVDIRGQRRDADLGPDLGAEEWRDSDADGLPDWIEARGASDPAGDPDGDGRDSATEYAGGTDPADYYDGALPSLVKVGGDGQSAEPGQFLLEPLVVAVTNAAGALTNAPLAIESVSGGGLLSLTNDGTGLAESLSLRTGGDGQVSFYLRYAAGPSNAVLVSARSANRAATATFVARDDDTDDDGLPDPWEIEHFGDLGQGPTGDPDGDGRDNATELAESTGPMDFFDGNLPDLFVVGGDGQRARRLRRGGRGRGAEPHQRRHGPSGRIDRDHRARWPGIRLPALRRRMAQSRDGEGVLRVRVGGGRILGPRRGRRQRWARRWLGDALFR